MVVVKLNNLFRIKAPWTLLFCIILTLSCERSLLPKLGVIGVYIIFITFGHWTCVNMLKWPNRHLSIIIGSKSLIRRKGLSVARSWFPFFLHSFLSFLSPHTSVHSLGCFGSDHAITSLSQIKVLKGVHKFGSHTNSLSPYWDGKIHKRRIYCCNIDYWIAFDIVLHARLMQWWEAVRLLVDMQWKIYTCSM